MKFLRTTMLALGLALLAAQPATASVMSDGSSGVFRPTADFTLDLSGTTFPQYSSIFIDAGIRLTVLTPTGGVFGDLLAANDIFVNGIIDAGSGYLGLLAGNQIVLGTGSQLIGGSLNLIAGTTVILNSGSIVDATFNTGTRLGLSPLPDLNSGGTISIGSGSSINIGAGSSVPVVGRVGPVSGSEGFIVLDGGSGTISVDNGGSIDLVSCCGQIGSITLITIPEPSTILLLLPGLALLARKSWPHERAA